MYDELIKRLKSVYQDIDCPNCPLSAECMKLQSVCAFTQAADAIDELTDRNVGKWEERVVEDPKYDPYGFFKRRWYCSACGKWQTHGATKYCPNCGAQMEEA